MPYAQPLFFVFGALLGSFLNVVALRYDGERFLFGHQLTGRSHCAQCGKQLRWLELIPLVSFLLQRGRCRNCQSNLSWIYPIGEMVTAFSFAAIPGIVLRVFPALLPTPLFWLVCGLFALAFSTLIVAALIDIRLTIIPDEVHVFLLFISIALGLLLHPYFGFGQGSFLGGYALLFGGPTSFLYNHLLATAFGGFFFLFLYWATFRRGMGLGDVKLAAVLGAFVGWPDIVIICLLSFVLGALVSLPYLAAGRRQLKSMVPFGPFLVAAVFCVLIWGQDILHYYFLLFRG